MDTNIRQIVEAWDDIDNKFLDAVLALAELSGVTIDDEWGVAKDVIEYAIGVVGGNSPTVDVDY